MSNSKFSEKIEKGDESKVPLDKLFETKKAPDEGAFPSEISLPVFKEWASPGLS